MAAPLFHRIAGELRTQVQSGNLRVGDRVPSESELMLTFSAPQASVRQALEILRAEGLIGGRSGSPLTVLKAVLSQNVDSYVPFTAWARTLGREPGSRTLEMVMRPADGFVAEMLGLPPRSMVLSYTRVRTLDGEPVMIERSSLIERVGQTLDGFDPDSGSIMERLATRGTESASAVHRIETEAATGRDAVLLGVARRAPLLKLTRRTSDQHGTAFEVGVDRYRGDAFAMVFHSHRPR